MRQSAIVGLMAWTVLAAAAQAAEPKSVVVPLIASHVDILDKDLPGYSNPSGLQLSAFTQPLHGTLTRIADGFRYSPGTHFWSLASDRFVYKYNTLAGARATTVLLTKGQLGPSGLEGFENGAPSVPPWATYNPAPARLTFDAAGALEGALGMSVAHGSTPAFVTFDTPAEWFGSSAKGGGAQGSHTSVRIRLPRASGSGPNVAGQSEIVLKASLDDAPIPEYSLALQLEPDLRYRLTLQVRGAEAGAPLVTWIAPGAHDLDVYWWPGGAAAGETVGGVWVEVDSLVRLGPLALDNFGALVTKHWFGSVAPGQGGLAFALDSVEVSQIPKLGDELKLLASDFEDGAGEWDTSQGSGLSRTSSPSPSGFFSLDVPLELGQRGFWLNVAPASERHLSLRYDVTALDTLPQLAVGDSVQLLNLVNSDALASTKIVVRVRLRQTASQLVLETQARQDDDTFLGVQWPLVDLSTHALEVQWQAASGAQAQDGFVRVWVDGQVVGERLEFDNDSQRVEALRLGAQGALPASGRLRFDNVHLWR